MKTDDTTADRPAGPFKNYLTPRGFQRLCKERDWLLRDERPRVVAEVAYAASLGDRSENAEYIYGKKRLRAIDRRLRWLRKRIDAAEVVEPAIDRGTRVFFGATVTVGYPDGRERTVELVGEDEIDSEIGRISWKSPLGRAVMRKEEGDGVRFEHAGEVISLEIIEVDYRAQEPDDDDRAMGTRIV